ncbi:CRISPR-associated Csx4 family protein [Actinomadura pelletieri DSM 43383]|uniref:CRISPR-associated Csx4 family protein n=1 Tax=Actinomadura pelletieri DSM 43383 TaxID=1120940 RepID=A0A495Q9Y0_9ACTN|nr:type I-U CRISPR-associated RAMP protein Csb1/Cas7u [Actinomadura pelletieri]RKS68272.1 CRISPR-associated Csx4 family protein [Actinomadura pelletieri DSM 43383]
MESAFVERLLVAVDGERVDAGVSIHGVYRPAGEDKVMPPTFPEGPYLMEGRRVGGEMRETVVLDQVPSQANRVEEALLAARDKGQIELPLFELQAPTSRGTVRLTSLEFPHRYADAYLRDSLVDGVRFDKSQVGKRLRQVSQKDARPLFELDPGSLIYGAWDSHRKGRWPKFARFYISSMFGLDPRKGERRSMRRDPMNMTGGVDDAGKAEGDWEFRAAGEKSRGTRLSEIGHGSALARTPPPGGVVISEGRRDAWISLGGLERVRFGDASDECVRLARATLLALALVGDRLAFDRPSVWLRSGCDLVRVSETLAFEKDGGEAEEFTLSAGEAIEIFHELRDRTAASGLVMETGTIGLTPFKGLADALEHAVTKAVAEG